MVGVLPGKFRQDALSKADLPTVGDWVVVSPIDNDETDRVQIEKLLERKSKFSRKEAGEVHDEQVVASNIDTVFIVSALDRDFNLHRIERYLLLSWTSGARPVLSTEQVRCLQKHRKESQGSRSYCDGFTHPCYERQGQ